MLKTNTKDTLKIFWQYSGHYKFSGLAVVFFIIVTAALGAWTPWYYKEFFDTLAAGGAKETLVGKLVGILIVIAALNAVQWLGWRLATFLATYFQSHVMTDLADYCFAYLHRHSFSFFNNNFVGSLVKKVKWFARGFVVISDRFFWDLLTLLVNIIVIIAVLFQRNVYLAGGILVWIILFLVVNSFFARYKLKYDILRNEVETETTAVLADTITNNLTVKLFNGYQREVKAFEKVNEKLRRLRKFTWDLDCVFEAIQGFLMVFLEIGIFYLAIGLWRQGILTIGDFVLIQIYLVNIFHRVWEFGRVLRQIYEALSDAEEMTIILATPYEINDIHGAKKLAVKAGQIEFENVDFYYHQTRKVLKRFALTIAPGEHVALIGPSGAGKTTVVRLLLRLHEISGGKILIDGQDIAKVTQESLWQNISLVPQDPILFHRTLKENIRYGRPKATDQEVIRAAKLAHCHEFISQFGDGYNTYVGERGVKLSGGERQRVAIARSILRDSSILILDEATSSLDSHSEALIQDAMDKLMADKTVIAIAHRLSTIRKMDRIIVVAKGGISEQGSHEELIKNPTGLYNRLWQMQAGGFIK